ncbi:MAG: MBL fold metallo-hydrolase [Lachnospiraceae bacterium]|jgi:L-ascorbate metabolism protein UlaG (beta-lactamase superfamily)
MKVTYLNHSGFLLEWEHCCWLIDYYKGGIPELDPQKNILVFCSHSHADHFNPAIFALFAEYPSVTYIFSNQIRRAYNKLQKQAGEHPLPPVQFLKSRTDTCLSLETGSSIQIHTLQSTDCGCAFLLQYENKTIYHAGDLHWWLWPEESEAWNKKMTSDYKKEMEYLKNQDIDLAFTPLDPRQKQAYALGINYLLETASVKHLFPMHFWNDFSIIDTYMREYKVPKETCFHTLKQDGQTIEIML